MAQQVAATKVMIVPKLTPEAYRVIRHRRTRRSTVDDELTIPSKRIIRVHVRDPDPLQSADRPPHCFHRVALRVVRLRQGVCGATPFQAVRPVQSRGNDVALTVKLRDRLAAVEQGVRLRAAKAIVVPGAQAVGIVSIGGGIVAVPGGQPVFGVVLGRMRRTAVEDFERVAVAVVGNGLAGIVGLDGEQVLVVGV